MKCGDRKVEGLRVISHLVSLCNIHGQQVPEDDTDRGQ